jgi:hypothetical protein
MTQPRPRQPMLMISSTHAPVQASRPNAVLFPSLARMYSAKTSSLLAGRISEISLPDSTRMVALLGRGTSSLYTGLDYVKAKDQSGRTLHFRVNASPLSS